jgi:hypothetical protein
VVLQEGEFTNNFLAEKDSPWGVSYKLVPAVLLEARPKITTKTAIGVSAPWVAKIRYGKVGTPTVVVPYEKIRAKAKEGPGEEHGVAPPTTPPDSVLGEDGGAKTGEGDGTAAALSNTEVEAGEGEKDGEAKVGEEDVVKEGAKRNGKGKNAADAKRKGGENAGASVTRNRKRNKQKNTTPGTASGNRGSSNRGSSSTDTLRTERLRQRSGAR